LGPLRVLAFEGRSFLSRRTDDARRWRPLIVANPPGDLEFRSVIDRIFLAGVDSPHDLETALRTRYPKTVVRRRELADEGFEVWYVYRDGHWIRSEEHA
jgi:hypothetical protein